MRERAALTRRIERALEQIARQQRRYEFPVKILTSDGQVVYETPASRAYPGALPNVYIGFNPFAEEGSEP